MSLCAPRRLRASHPLLVNYHFVTDEWGTTRELSATIRQERSADESLRHLRRYGTICEANHQNVIPLCSIDQVLVVG